MLKPVTLFSVSFVEQQYANKFNISNLEKCVCSNAKPLHYYALRVPRKVEHGVKCGLFSNNAPLGQTTLRVGRVSVQCCRKL